MNPLGASSRSRSDEIPSREGDSPPRVCVKRARDGIEYRFYEVVSLARSDNSSDSDSHITSQKRPAEFIPERCREVT